MLVLAIDTALDQTAVCLLDPQSAAPLASQSEAMQRGHAEALMPMVEAVIAASGQELSAIDRIAVTTGPGSFTGLRIGISAARGLGLALDRPVVGVGTIAAYAANAVLKHRDTGIAVVLDARNDQVYLQFLGANGIALSAPAAVSIGEAARLLRQRPSVITGTAAEPVRLACSRMGVVLQHVPCGPGPDIEMVARIGAFADPALSRAKPLYVRPPAVTPPAAMSSAQANAAVSLA